jgi:hypothetical protein
MFTDGESVEEQTKVERTVKQLQLLSKLYSEPELYIVLAVTGTTASMPVFVGVLLTQKCEEI